jgi:Hydrazine synthase alpha subunit middle domain
MNKPRAATTLSFVIAAGFLSIFFPSCSRKHGDRTIIFTISPKKVQNVTYAASDSLGIGQQEQIVELDPGKAEARLKILSSQFYSAMSPQISYDGHRMLFCARLKQNDTWQIWEMNLKNLKSRQIIALKENCTDPCYLPPGRFVFSKSAPCGKLKSSISLFTCNLDGSDLQRITFDPHTYSASNVLSDGRILTTERPANHENGDPKYIILRPDGTKTELFYKGTEGNNLSGQGLETASGKVVFIESSKENPATGNIISVSYNRPLHSKVNLTSETKGDFCSVFPQRSGKLLVIFRKSESERFSLYEFDPETKTIGKKLYNNIDFDVLEALEVEKRVRPKKLPSEVHPDIKTGLIVCQDVNLNNSQLSVNAISLPKSPDIEIMGVDSSLGIVHAAKDGSLYLRVLADTPFQIRSLDKDGHVLQSCDWVWLRPNERRGCVGCHEGQEIAPENRIPLAVKKSPISIPVPVKKIKEKLIDTE